MQKPDSVKRAELAIWATLALSVLTAVIDRKMDAISTGMFMYLLFSYGLSGIIPYKIGQGKNWARVTHVLLAIASLAIMSAGVDLEMSRLAVVVAWASLPIDALIAYWLFRPENSEWFNPR